MAESLLDQRVVVTDAVRGSVLSLTLVLRDVADL